MEYFDSLGHPPSSLIKKQCALIMGPKENRWTQPATPAIRHQMGGTQCGMYAAWFILQRIVVHKTWDEIQSKRVPDEEMERLRDDWFRAPDPELVAALIQLKI